MFIVRRAKACSIIAAFVAGFLSVPSSANAAPRPTGPSLPEPTSINLSVAPGSLALNTPVTLTSTVTAVGNATGSVEFMDSGATIANCAAVDLVYGKAVCSTSFSSTGAHILAATYRGDDIFGSSTSPSIVETVGAVNPPIQLDQPAESPSAASPKTPRVVSASIAMGRSAATTPVTTASIPSTSIPTYGNSNSTIRPLLLSSTTTITSSSVNPSVTGQPVTLKASVTGIGPPPSGTVTFKDGAANIAGCVGRPIVAGSATCLTAFATAGAHPITAVYSGDANFNPSTSAVLTQTVNKGNTTTALASSVNPSVTGQSVTYTASPTASLPAVGSPSGTVDFQDGGVDIPGCAAQVVAAGSATCVVTYPGPGSHPITAVYAGDANFNPSTSAVLTQTVKQASTTVGISATPSPSTYGKPVTITVSVRSSGGTPTGSVTITDGVVLIGTATLDPSGQATLSVSTLVAGPHYLMGTYAGDANFTGNSTPSFNEVVNRATTTVTVSLSPSRPSAGEPVIISAVVTPVDPPTGTVTFLDNGIVLGTSLLDAGATARLTATIGVGSNLISADYGGDANYLGSAGGGILVSVATGAVGSTGTGSAGTPLAWTGIDILHAVCLGLAMCLLGLALLLVGRRRERDRHQSS